MEANGILANIQEQIKSCNELLAIFQEERKAYLEGGMPAPKQMAETLIRKKRLLELFDGQRELLKRICSEEKDSPEAMKEQKKALMRELASILEKLLVIDQENERLLREASTTVRRPLADAAVAARQRPSLQRQLPLMPFDSASQKSQAAEVRPARVQAAAAAPAAKRAAAPSPASPAQTGMPVRPKAHLREYAFGAVKTLNQGPKYA